MQYREGSGGHAYTCVRETLNIFAMSLCTATSGDTATAVLLPLLLLLSTEGVAALVSLVFMSPVLAFSLFASTFVSLAALGMLVLLLLLLVFSLLSADCGTFPCSDDADDALGAAVSVSSFLGTPGEG